MSDIHESREKKIRSITSLYYSKPWILKAIFDFSRNREVTPRYFNGFGKRPDSFLYESDIFELVKKGATSFHCSEEIWKNPLEIETGMSPDKLNDLRIGWDLLIDIDSKYIDYSKVSAQVILRFLEFYGVKNVGVKFSGSKGFHLIIPWKSLPKNITGIKTSDMFPSWARIVVEFMMESTKKEIASGVGKIQDEEKYGSVSKYIRGESKEKSFSEDVMPDLILVSPRHLFRMPYSLHEKTSLASIVLSREELKNFQMSDADPLKVSSEKIRNFSPDSREGEATKLFVEALDWNKSRQGNDEKTSEKNQTDSGGFEKKDFKPIKFEKLSDSQFPPSIQKILNGLRDGKKRALFILINFFRFINLDRDEMEKRIYDWNKKNTPPLMDGYVKTQISWSYRRSAVLPPNFDKDYYKGIGIVPSAEELAAKNPVTYMLKKFSKISKEKKSRSPAKSPNKDHAPAKKKSTAKTKSISKATDNFKNLN